MDTENGSEVQGVVKSARRVLEVLDYFRQARRPLSAVEIGVALGYPKSSTNVLLRSLVTLGYLTLDMRTLRYFPSLSVTLLGDWIPFMVLASGDAFEIITEVHAATQETVTLCVQSDTHCRFLKVLPGTFPISLRLTEGFVVPLTTTAVGMAILSQLTNEEVAAVIDRINTRVRRRSDRVDLATVQRALNLVRERGFAMVAEGVFPDTAAIAVPFPSDMSSLPMAIGVGGLRDRILRSESGIVRAVQASLARHGRRASRLPRDRRKGIRDQPP
jgi:DNA-binding IclR family transcriptional regulator